MFGYIVPQVSELKVREYELYRAYYCGLCKMLKQEYKKNAVLNYDSVFLYLLADGLREEQGTVEPCKCAFHPVKKRSAVITPAASYAADVNILMAYFQIEDNLRDGKKGMRLTKALFKKAFDKAARRRRGMVEVARKTIGKVCKYRCGCGFLCAAFRDCVSGCRCAAVAYSLRPWLQHWQMGLSH